MTAPDAVTPTVEAERAEVEWALSLVLARYAYGEAEWLAFDPEERNAIAEPYLHRARRMAPMVASALAPYVARHAALAAQAALNDVERRFTAHGEWAWLMPRLLGPVREVRAALGEDLLNDYDPTPGLIARGVMSDPDDHDPESCEADCCTALGDRAVEAVER